MKKSLFILLLFVFSAFFLFSQEAESANEETESETAEPVLLPDDDGLYVIAGFEFDIKGRTRPFALLYKTELKIGEQFHGRAELDAFIADKTQVLINLRVLKDNATITPSVGEQKADGSYPVILRIKVEDTWNIIAVPRPQYSSNSGFDITIKARDYNSFGTMSPLRLDLGYSYDEEGRNYFNLMLDTDTPFRLFNLDWNFNFDHDFIYRPNRDEPYYYKNTTGISVEIPWKKTVISAGFSESLMLNQEVSRTYWDEYGEFHKGIYMSSNLGVSLRIPTGFHYYHLGELTYSPGISATFNHEFPRWPLYDFMKGPFLSFSHGLNFGRVDWVDNFRKGVSAGIGNSFGFDFYALRNGGQPWSASLSVSAQGHKIISKHVSFSARLMYRHWFFGDYTDTGGGVIRGVLDNDIYADYMFSMNMDLPISLLKFRPSEWFKRPKWRIINFDLHVSPFVDLAFYNDPVNQAPFGFENMLLGAGLELIVFPQAFRSLFLRASFGLGIETARLSRTLSREIYIGTELHY